MQQAAPIIVASAEPMPGPSPELKRVRTLIVLAVVLGTSALLVPHQLVTLGLTATAATLIVLAWALGIRNRASSRKKMLDFNAVLKFIEKDCASAFVTSSDGRILSRNDIARDEFPDLEHDTLAAALQTTFANPSGIIFRLQSKAGHTGAAREDIVTRSGHVRLSVHEMDRHKYIWRFEKMVDQQTRRNRPDAVNLPMITVGRTGAILFMNDAARALIGSRIKSLDRLFTNLPPVSGSVTEISTTLGKRNVILSEVAAGAGRRALYLLPASPGDVGDVGWHAFEDLPVPLIKVSPEGAVTAFNATASRLIGVSLETDVNLSKLMEGLGRPIADWLADTLAGKLFQKSEFLRLTRQDREVFVQVSLNRVTENGAPALIAVLSDATELKTLEAQFVQSQKMQAIGQLAGGVAHDFNNLLTAISGHCDLLLLRHDQGDPDYADLMQINQNANRAAALVGQLLAFSRKQTLRPETLDLRDTLADLTHLLNRLVGEKVTLTLSHDPVLQPIRADKRQLEQVLMNLVLNARDAMPAGGEIKIITECLDLIEPLTRDRVTMPTGRYVTVQVCDDGVGIAPDKLQKVFEPFFTTKRTGEGTGLGLSTAYGIIKQTGGFIFVDSKLGAGTVFTLYFPVLDAPELTTSVARAPTPHPLLGQADGVVLLVEDEASVRAFASRALKLRGYTVLEAESAEAALKTLEDQNLVIDVFVTDVVMPGMDGPTWVREALKARPEVRVVFVSGYAEDSFGESQRKIPNSVFLPKPFSLSDLTETVHNQLH